MFGHKSVLPGDNARKGEPTWGEPCLVEFARDPLGMWRMTVVNANCGMRDGESVRTQEIADRFAKGSSWTASRPVERARVDDIVVDSAIAGARSQLDARDIEVEERGGRVVRALMLTGGAARPDCVSFHRVTRANRPNSLAHGASLADAFDELMEASQLDIMQTRELHKVDDRTDASTYAERAQMRDELFKVARNSDKDTATASASENLRCAREAWVAASERPGFEEVGRGLVDDCGERVAYNEVTKDVSFVDFGELYRLGMDHLREVRAAEVEPSVAETVLDEPERTAKRAKSGPVR